MWKTRASCATAIFPDARPIDHGLLGADERIFAACAAGKRERIVSAARQCAGRAWQEQGSETEELWAKKFEAGRDGQHMQPLDELSQPGVASRWEGTMLRA